jgi:hypothetical protein
MVIVSFSAHGVGIVTLIITEWIEVTGFTSPSLTVTSAWVFGAEPFLLA